MKLVALAPAAAVVALVACGRGPEPVAEAEGPKAQPAAATTPAPKPAEKRKFGGDVTEQTSTPLDALVKTPEKFTAKTVRTEGKVSAVCQHMGCWMEIADASGKAHIKMAGHSFFVPKDAAGHHAVVQGTVMPGDKDHCTEEAAEQTGGVAKVEIEANAIELVD
ncbi:MAG TPA: DUF4920 domain-containing protein [Byssovorax sp.]|jgi:hypothetical protein